MIVSCITDAFEVDLQTPKYFLYETLFATWADKKKKITKK